MDKFCLDCNKKLSKENKLGRCVPCMNKHRATDPVFLKQCKETRERKKDPAYEDPKRFCIDCGQELKGHGLPLRCRSCASKVVMKILVNEGRAGTPCTEERKQGIASGVKAAHARGCYDDWMEEFAKLGASNWDEPEIREKLILASKEYWLDTEHRLEASERSKAYCKEHPEFMEALQNAAREYWSSQENRDAHAEFMRNYFIEHPEHVERMCDASIEYFAIPSNREKATEKFKESIASYYLDPENRRRCSEILKQLHIDNPEFHERMVQHVKDRMMPALMEWLEDPSSRELLSNLAAERMSKGFQHPSSLEREVQSILDECGIEYVAQYKPEGYNRIYDFLLPSYRLLLEVDGYYWHSSPDAIAWGQAETDAEKDKWAVANGYKMLRLPEADMRSTGARELLFSVI